MPGSHLAYFITDVVDQLDLTEIVERYEREERGYPPYHPRMMVKVLLYAYCWSAFVAQDRQEAGFRESRLRKIREARQALEDEARQQAK